MSCFIGISGPTASGKSSVARRLMCAEIGHVPMDNFYRPHHELGGEREEINWDHPEAMGFERLYGFLKKLQREGRAEMPVFRMNVNVVVDRKVVTLKPAMIVEGLMLFYDRRIRDLLDERIFIEVPKEVQIERRKSRARENEDRVFDEEVFREAVYPGYEKFFQPTKKHADHVIDGTRDLDEVTEEVGEIVLDRIP